MKVALSSCVEAYNSLAVSHGLAILRRILIFKLNTVWKSRSIITELLAPPPMQYVVINLRRVGPDEMYPGPMIL
jgi:hypothetical protein